MGLLGGLPGYSYVSGNQFNASEFNLHVTRISQLFNVLQLSSIFTSSENDYTGYENETVSARLELPWHKNYWNIKVTHVVSPNEVWAILTENSVKTH